MPPARTWFKTPGAPEEAEDSSDDDIEIAQEHISYNCPLTLVQFVNPVKSAVCSHHFEKEAIYQLIGRGPSVDCPVGGCNQIITKADLVEDHYMIQKIQRHEQALVRQRRRDEREEGEEGGRREEEEEEEEEGVSETPISTEDLARIKKEKGAAARPKARRRGARPTIMELEDSDMEE